MTERTVDRDESIAEPGDKWDRAIRSLDDIDTAYSDRCDAQ